MPYKDPGSDRAKAARAAARRRYEERSRRDSKDHALRSPKTNPTPTEPRRRRAGSSRKTRDTERLNRGRQAATFIGVDGEGWTDHTCGTPDNCPGVDCHHHYVLLVAGDRALEHGGRPLAGWECVDFLARLPAPPNTHYVSYFFDYDATMILRDWARAEPDRMRWHVTPEDKGGRPYGHTQEFGTWLLDYVPRKHFKAQAAGAKPVTVHDTRAFFQSSFAQALEDFGVGTPDERARIAGMKAQRATFGPGDWEHIVDYCKEECRLLAALMAELRDRFAAADMSAHPYEGPGPVAGRQLTRIGAQRGGYPTDVADLANRAYYGGRFEIAAHGSVLTPVYGYDIHSAYPDAMTRLPCLEHGKWVPGIESDLWVGQVAWDSLPTHREGHWDDNLAGGAAWGHMGPLPWRSKAGTIAFPTQGEGWYWSVEASDRAEPSGTAWSYVPTCNCQPFAQVRELYERRREMEATQKGSGVALKLVLNSLYGKLAQRLGKPQHLEPVWAGLITAMTRAKVYDVYLRHPGKVVMFATDAVFLTEPAPELELGGGLGQWEMENDNAPYKDFCLFMPGVYFDGASARFKTRGVPKADFRQQADRFREIADQWATRPPLSVELRRTNHLALRQGLAWATSPQSANRWLPRIGDWVAQPRQLSPDPHNKRIPGEANLRGGAFWSMPWPDAGLTTPYQAAMTGDEDHPFGGEESVMWSEGLYDGDVD